MTSSQNCPAVYVALMGFTLGFIQCWIHRGIILKPCFDALNSCCSQASYMPVTNYCKHIPPLCGSFHLCIPNKWRFLVLRCSLHCLQVLHATHCAAVSNKVLITLNFFQSNIITKNKLTVSTADLIR